MAEQKSVGELAKHYFLDEKQNCSQSVFRALKETFAPETDDVALKMAAGFGGGIGDGETCGALCGAVMAVGLLSDCDTHDDKTKLMAKSKATVQYFKQNYESPCCRELIKNFEKGKPEQREYCAQFVMGAAEFAAGVVSEPENAGN